MSTNYKKIAWTFLKGRARNLILLNLGFAFGLALVVELATYKYAVEYRIRIPFEGVPFFRQLSLLLSFLVSLSIYFWTLLVLYCVSVSQNLLPDNSIGFNKLNIFSGAIVAFALSYLLVSWLFEASIFLKIDAHIRESIGIVDFSKKVLNFVYVTMALGLLLRMLPLMGFLLPVIGTLVVFCTLSLIVLSETGYSRILKFCGYGGPSSVLVKIVENDALKVIDGNLVLRTNEAIFLRSRDTSAITEYSLKDVHSIELQM